MLPDKFTAPDAKCCFLIQVDVVISQAAASKQ